MANEKKMKVIALKGPHDCGKTQTLTIVYFLLLDEGYKQAAGKNFKYLYGETGDFRDILEFDGKKIGIVTQGDYDKKNLERKDDKLCTDENLTALTVEGHLTLLGEKKCDIAICAINSDRKDIEEEIKIFEPDPIEKANKEESPLPLQRIENFQKAIEVRDKLREKLDEK